jgi:alpha-methylacyl-CoA racemase
MSFTGNHPETLRGVRILDLTRLLPGPFCTMLLADLGADVIKLEAPLGGDYARWYPPHIGEGAASMGAFFASINRGKRSLTLDLKRPAGRALLLRLVETADVLVESFRPGVMERLGLGPDALAERKPELVYCAISGYGQDGPYRDRAGHDLNYLALAGALEQTGPRGGHPLVAGYQLADIAGGGLYAALGILAALFDRQRSGRGARLDISMTEGALTFMGPLAARLRAGQPLPDRGADQLSGGLPCYRVYATRDGGHMALAALEPKFWASFCHLVGKPEWVSAGHFADSPIHSEVEALFASRDRDDWTALLAEHDVCCEPVLGLDEVLESTLMGVRRLFFTLGAPGAPQSLQTASPVTPALGRLALRAPPRLGEHSVELLRELGVDKAELDALIADGVTTA